MQIIIFIILISTPFASSAKSFNPSWRIMFTDKDDKEISYKVNPKKRVEFEGAKCAMTDEGATHGVARAALNCLVDGVAMSMKSECANTEVKDVSPSLIEMINARSRNLGLWIINNKNIAFQVKLYCE